MKRIGLRRRAYRLAWCALLTGMGCVVLAQRPSKPGRVVDLLTVKGDVNPVLVGYIERGIRTAEKQGAEMVLIRLDTPGGQLESTRDITQDFLAAGVPVGVYVWPAGGRAGSAGVFITMAAHVAGMAPQTNIGAAHPVLSGGGEEGGGSEQAKTLTKKVTNDAVALIRNLAEVRGRNVDWAEKAVRESVSIGAQEAVRLHVADFVAGDTNGFLKQADGMRVRVKQGERTLHTAGARVAELPMSWREEFLFRLANPNIAYILLMLGVYALIFELKSPTHGAAGVFGAICLILALYSLSVLPVNFAGLALIVVGIGFLFAELIHHTHGVLTLGGTISLAIGSLILINNAEAPELRVSRPLIAGVVFATLAFFVFVLGAVVKGQRRKVVTGAQGMIGLVGDARTELNPEGTVFVEGSWWTASAQDPPIEAGAAVTVVAVQGLHLVVERPPVTPDEPS